MKSNGLFFGWIVVGVAAVAMLLAAGGRSAPGVLLVAMEQPGGFSRATLSLAASLGLVMFGLAAPLSGALIDRLGPRRVSLAGLLLTAASFVLSAGVSREWQLHLVWGVLSGLGTGLLGSVLGATVANRWFVRHRGLVTGIFGAATSAGQLLFVPLLATLGEGIGWRSTSLGIGLLALLLLPVVALWLRDAPQQLGLVPLGSVTGTAPARAADPGRVMLQVLHTPTFWLLAASFFVCGATSSGLVGTHFVAHAAGHGMAVTAAAGVLALMGAFNFVGTLASGVLTDRFDPRRLLAVYYIFRGFSLFLLPYVHEGAGLVVFAVLFGLDYIATVPPTVMLVANHFGRANVGSVYGWVFCAHQLGAALAAWLGGLAQATLGDYTLAFLAGGVIAILGGLLVLGLRNTPPSTALAS
ncbi:sugar phosphate permease [Deinobacterium chartae]|uniref:Sugar phosphate permease n=1 Tax=Deinobacterium chartae TaxID=521158 RepID=A0A841HYF9_9DEIO|nr:MFS transporter [Deinobacterium chartae]MBB6096952.1 sugar phosphate permease [Deinobacterium chartae]